jgi:hypothetical protein
MLNDRLADLIQGRHPAIRSVVIVRSTERGSKGVIARIQAPTDRHTEIRQALNAATASFQPRGMTLTYQLIGPV